MVRLISEFTSNGNAAQFRITSLKPLRAENKASTWETKALKSFQNGQSEYGSFEHKGSDDYKYHYMAPLYAGEKCLQCHDQQGYESGDILGGISVILPLQEKPNNWPLILTHILVATVGVVLIRFLVNQLIDSQEKMELLASRDSLTGVANRRFFLEYLRREWLRSKRNETSLAFIMCDIDLFKQYNQAYGHQAGDNCLYQVAETISSVLHRPGDFIARYGGVKFAIILPETPIEGAEVLAKKMLKLVEDLKIEHLSSHASKYVTVSIGVTDNVGLSMSNEIIAQADNALNQAKEMGRNRIVRLAHVKDTEAS
jgi:diguanylate cyclase (GGDEF)-like protein